MQTVIKYLIFESYLQVEHVLILELIELCQHVRPIKIILTEDQSLHTQICRQNKNTFFDIFFSNYTSNRTQKLQRFTCDFSLLAPKNLKLRWSVFNVTIATTSLIFFLTVLVFSSLNFVKQKYLNSNCQATNPNAIFQS